MSVPSVGDNVHMVPHAGWEGAREGECWAATVTRVDRVEDGIPCVWLSVMPPGALPGSTNIAIQHDRLAQFDTTWHRRRECPHGTH